jgi:hypothetical protein
VVTHPGRQLDVRRPRLPPGSARRGPSLDGINEVFDRMERGQIDGRMVIDYR